MATLEAIQPALDSQGTRRKINVLKSQWYSSSKEDFYCVSHDHPGRARWVECNPADSAATQAAAIVARMLSAN